jgi:hypothetical protein
MGIYTETLKCGCIAATCTLEIPPQSFILQHCPLHAKEKDEKTEKKTKSETPPLNSNGDTSRNR